MNENQALLDKAVFNKIRIKGFTNFEELQERGILTVNQKSKVNYITESGAEFTKLQIKGDELMDNLYASAKIMGNHREDYCTLSTTIRREDGTNLCCYTADEYRAHLERIEDHLICCYGIDADFSELSLKEVEINKTFKLEQDFREYYRVLRLIMHNLPSVFHTGAEFFDRKKKGELTAENDTGTYYARTGSRKSDKYLLLKIYDKSRSVEKKIVLTDSYMRVELRIVGTSKIKTSLGTCRMDELTDEIINEYFDKQMKKCILDPFKRWKKERDRHVLSIMRKQKKEVPRYWIINTLRILANEEIENKYCPVILDVNELMELIPKVENDRKLLSKTKKAFLEQAEKYEPVFTRNDGQKIDELLQHMSPNQGDT